MNQLSPIPLLYLVLLFSCGVAHAELGQTRKFTGSLAAISVQPGEHYSVDEQDHDTLEEENVDAKQATTDLPIVAPLERLQSMLTDSQHLNFVILSLYYESKAFNFLVPDPEDAKYEWDSDYVPSDDQIRRGSKLPENVRGEISWAHSSEHYEYLYEKAQVKAKALGFLDSAPDYLQPFRYIVRYLEMIVLGFALTCFSHQKLRTILAMAANRVVLACVACVDKMRTAILRGVNVRVSIEVSTGQARRDKEVSQRRTLETPPPQSTG